MKRHITSRKKGLILDNSSIGLFDSGLGGLSVVLEVNQLLPNENIEYFADHARLPYGPRKKKEIKSFVIEIINYLLSKDIKASIIGCNTATAAGLEKAQEIFDIPIIGVIEPGVRVATEQTLSGRIGLTATEFTIKSQEHIKKIKQFSPEAKVFANHCPEFFRLVEYGCFETKEAYQIAQRYLEPIKKENVDTLILGCTHYPFLSKVIKDIMGPQVKLINPAYSTALEMKGILEEKNLLRKGQIQRVEHYYTTGDPEAVTKIANLILGYRKCRFAKVSLANFNRS